MESYAELLCFLLIVDLTIGLSRTWAKIQWSQFENINRRGDQGGLTRRWCQEAIKKLLEDGSIRSRKAQVGTGWEYALAVRSTGDGDSRLAACRNCKRTDDIEIDADFIPVPHSFFRALPAACDRGMYLIMMAVLVRTMRISGKEIVSTPCEITVEDFKVMTGLERAEVLKDLQKLQAEGFDVLGSAHHGRTVYYWTKPENFAKGQARASREVHQPANKKRKGETEKTPKVDQTTDTKQSIRLVEFLTQPCGYCRHCNTYGPVDLVEVSENLIKKTLGSANRTEQRARAGLIDQIQPSWPSYKAPDWKKEA